MSVDSESKELNVLGFYFNTEMIDDESNDACNDCKSFSIALNNSSMLHDLRDRNNNEEELLSSRNNNLTTINATKDEKSYLELSLIKEPRINLMSKDIKGKDILAKKLAKLTLDSDCESLNKFAELSVEDSNPQEQPFAGFVTAVAKVLGLIVVKPPMPHHFLLNLGSPVFLHKSSATGVPTNEVKVGQIIDVFGPTFEPYYCIKPVKNGIDLVREGTRLSYAPDHPRTTFIRLERDEGNRYTVFYFDQRNGYQIYDDERIHFSRDMRDEFTRRHAAYRRRATGDRKTSKGYKNSLKKKFSGSYDEIVEPKHLYFNY